ncbi:MAG TPA: GNAT family N-acetyltransferase [Xanthobacteraceae bacterium]|nr:GNAT family N-acetyltransferase [Xanthobacteraceae bacterium]
MTEGYGIRQARVYERNALTRLAVRATRHLGYDNGFIERVTPTFAVTLRSIMVGDVQVCEDESLSVVGVVSVGSTLVQRALVPGSRRTLAIVVLGGIFVEPAQWRRGIGRRLFAAAVARARERGAGVLMINAEPSAEGFYQRLGAIRVGESPFDVSPDVILPLLMYMMPREV